MAINQVTRQILKKNPDFFPIKPINYDRILVISLGAGSNRNEHKYNAKTASKWGIISWLYENGSTPILDAYNQSKDDMVDMHIRVVFEAYQSIGNYLRIDVSFN